MVSAKPGDKLGGFYLTKAYSPEPNPHREYQMFLSNWPESWKQKVITSEVSRNNWGEQVQHFWFKGDDNHEWYGRLTGKSKDLVDFILKTKKMYYYNKEGFCTGVS